MRYAELSECELDEKRAGVTSGRSGNEQQVVRGRLRCSDAPGPPPLLDATAASRCALKGDDIVNRRPDK